MNYALSTGGIFVSFETVCPTYSTSSCAVIASRSKLWQSLSKQCASVAFRPSGAAVPKQPVFGVSEWDSPGTFAPLSFLRHVALWSLGFTDFLSAHGVGYLAVHPSAFQRPASPRAARRIRAGVRTGNGFQLPVGGSIPFPGSSEEFVGGFGLWQLAKRVIECEFESTEGAKAVGFSHSDFGFVVQTLDNARKQLSISSRC